MTLCQQRGSAEFMRFELRGASFEHEPQTLSEMKVRAASLIAAAGRSEVTREPPCLRQAGWKSVLREALKES
jgi:hypothetical protein